MKLENRILHAVKNSKSGGLTKKDITYFFEISESKANKAIQNLVRCNLLQSIKHPNMVYNGLFYVKGFKSGKYNCIKQTSKVRHYLILRSLRGGKQLTAEQIQEKTGFNISMIKQKLTKMLANNEVLSIRPKNQSEKAVYLSINHCSPEKAHFHNAFASLYYGAKKKRVSA